MQRQDQLREAVVRYFDGLREKEFDLIPYHEDVSLRAPLAPGGVEHPLMGRENLRTTWWPPLPELVDAVRLLDIYVNNDLTAAIGEAELYLKLTPQVLLRVADRFTVDDDGQIVEQVNYFDPRDATNPGWRDEA